jgi:hypothetical protein
MRRILGCRGGVLEEIMGGGDLVQRMFAFATAHLFILLEFKEKLAS